MAARSAKALTGDEIDTLRQQLAAGKRPRVQLSGPQFDADATGTITKIGDPAVNGSDYITVRVKVNGISDELAFAPAELNIRRAGAAGRAGAAARGGAAAQGGAAALGGSAARGGSAGAAGSAARPSTRTTAKSTAETTPTRPAQSNERSTGESAPTRPTRSTGESASSRRAQSNERSTGESVTTPPAKQAAPARSALPAQPAKPARRGRSGPTPRVSFTVSSFGPSWTLDAIRGSKAIVKGAPLAPGVVTALAELLDQPALAEAVGQINEVALAEAQAQADRLRTELSQLEAVLATHQRPR